MHCNQKDLPELTGMQIQWDTKHCCGNMALAGHWHLHLRSQKYCQWDTSNKPNLALRNIKYLKIICEGNENFLYLEGWAIELYDIITQAKYCLSWTWRRASDSERTPKTIWSCACEHKEYFHRKYQRWEW